MTPYDTASDTIGPLFMELFTAAIHVRLWPNGQKLEHEQLMTTREDARLDALIRLNLLDTPPSETFDRITRTASQLFGLSIAAISLTDSKRQWFKSRVGVDHDSIPRHKAPCAEVAESSELLVIPDLREDEFYSASHLASQGIRFYAGAPLVTREGHVLEALCVLGTEPRGVSAGETSALKDMALMVMAQIELQHAFGRLDPTSGLLNRTQFFDELEDMALDQPGHRRLAVMVDIARPDHMRNGTRILGADYIDSVVQNAVIHMRAFVGPQGTAYHVGSTQFAFLAPAAVEESSVIGALRGLKGLSWISHTSTARSIATSGRNFAREGVESRI